MKNKKVISLVLIGIFLILAGIMFLGISIAQGSDEISQECDLDNIQVTYYHKVMPPGFGGTVYVAVLEAGQCKTAFRGEIDETSNVDGLIEQDIDNKIDSGQVTLNIETTPVFESDSGEFVTSSD